jgi:hypothetical protein
MMRYAYGIGAALVALAGCIPKETTVLVITQAADGITVDSLTADVAVTGVGMMSQPLPASGQSLVLPGHLVVRTPDFAGDVRVTLTATQPDGGPVLTSTCAVRSVPFQQVPMTMVLGAPPPDDCQITCAADSPPSPQCWDVAGTFTQLDFPRSEGSTRIFATKPTLGETVWANFDAEDSTYVESAEVCMMVARKVPESWFIERKRVDGDTWKLTVRGISAADCGRKRAGSAGRLAINGDRGWKIIGTPICHITDDAPQNTHCTVDVDKGTVDFKSGSPCGQCCTCADGAGLDIQLQVARQAPVTQ